MQLFTLPNPINSVHDRNKWLFDLEVHQISPPASPETPHIYDHNDAFLSHPKTDPKTPSFYYNFPSTNQPTPSCASVSPVASALPSVDQATAILDLQIELNCLREEFTKLRIEFHGFMDLVMK